jgi:hypothetical protein
LGNKCDLEVERCIERDVAEEKIKKMELTYCEVSAKTGVNIEEFFEMAIGKVIEKSQCLKMHKKMMSDEKPKDKILLNKNKTEKLIKGNRSKRC